MAAIDESKYFHSKYHGQWMVGHWVSGGIERVTSKCILCIVPDCSAVTLEPLILQHILPGSHIISDSWASYRNTGELGGLIYQHSIAVHERNFVQLDDPDIHIQNI